MHSHIYAGL